MSDTNTIGTEYVPQRIFDLHLQNLREKASYDKEITDERLDKFQAVMEKNFAELRAEIRTGFSELRGEVRRLDEKIDFKTEGLEKRIDDLHQSHNKWFAVFGILFSIATIVAPVAVAVVQYYLTR